MKNWRRKICLNAFDFLLSYLFKRHLLPLVRKSPLHLSLSLVPLVESVNQSVLSIHIRKNTHPFIIFGNFFEPLKNITRFAFSKSLQKYWTWTDVIFGHLFTIFWDIKTSYLSFYFKDYYTRKRKTYFGGLEG